MDACVMLSDPGVTDSGELPVFSSAVSSRGRLDGDILVRAECSRSLSHTAQCSGCGSLFDFICCRMKLF